MIRKPEIENISFSSMCRFTPRQRSALDALKAGKRFLLYGGALGGGKSFFMRWVLLRRLLELYGRFGLRNVPVMLACENYQSDHTADRKKVRPWR